MRKLLILVLSAVVIFSLSPFAQSAGFLIYEHGAAAMAMGGAFIGLANDPSAVFHNPAGIAWLNGTQISVGTTLITSSASLSLPNYPDPTFQTVDQEKQWFYPSTLYFTHKFGDKIAAGFGFFSPYGLGTKWPKDYPLKYISYEDDMKTFFFNPVVAYKVSDNFSVGVGVSYIYATLDFMLIDHEEIDIGPLIGLPYPIDSTFDLDAHLDSSGSGWGFNAGALFKTENFSIGFNWRSGFKIKFEGDILVELDDYYVPAPYDQLIPAEQITQFIPESVPASTEFNFPHILGVGIAYNLTNDFLFTADVHYVLWDTYKEVIVAVEHALFADKEIEENWENSFLLRGGLQYQLSESFALRGGFLYDQTPQPVESMDPMLPDADRWALTGGFGYNAGGLVIDAAFQYEVFSDRTSPNRNILIHPLLGNLGEGTYSNTAYLIGISIGYKF
jgi:long-chain fatty acid transport protein